MSKIALTPNNSGTGTLTIAAPNTDTDRTLTLPDATGTVVYADASGNVGIGGTVNLSAAQSTDGQIRISNTTTRASGNKYGIRFADSTFETNAAIYAEQGSSGNNASALVFGTNGGTGGIALTSATERMRIDASGNVSITQTPGQYTVDVAGGATAIANGGTVDFANASGMLVVNNHSSGAVSVYLCGGGGTTLIGQTVAQVGTFTYVAGIGGYRWTNNSGAAAVFGFFFVRTRTTA